jgi:CheY-like chemotaxis protein
MDEGGQLTIETWNETFDESRLLRHDRIEPGSYVALSIVDTGSGMDSRTLAHLFEPFFSTKEFGRGLGLSSIYGIVKQSSGSISVASDLGRGASFTIYLPRVPEAAAPEAASEPAPEAAPRGETILLVEDDEDVKSLVEEMLEQHGYSTLETTDPAEAIVVCESHPGPIHLLVADVVMPKMSGPQLAEHLSRMRPDMKVLFISGYVENEATRRAVSAGRAAFLAKPFTPNEFMRKVREVMDGSRRKDEG